MSFSEWLGPHLVAAQDQLTLKCLLLGENLSRLDLVMVEALQPYVSKVTALVLIACLLKKNLLNTILDLLIETAILKIGLCFGPLRPDSSYIGKFLLLRISCEIELKKSIIKSSKIKFGFFMRLKFPTIKFIFLSLNIATTFYFSLR